MSFIVIFPLIFIFTSLVKNKKHFLMTLLILEALMLLMLFSFYLSLGMNLNYLFLIFITLSACEGALGLSLLVSLTRSYSSDFLLMYNSLN